MLLLNEYHSHQIPKGIYKIVIKTKNKATVCSLCEMKKERIGIFILFSPNLANQLFTFSSFIGAGDKKSINFLFFKFNLGLIKVNFSLSYIKRIFLNSIEIIFWLFFKGEIEVLLFILNFSDITSILQWVAFSFDFSTL